MRENACVIVKTERPWKLDNSLFCWGNTWKEEFQGESYSRGNRAKAS